MTTYRFIGPDWVQVAFIWPLAKARKFIPQPPCFLWLAVMVPLYIDQVGNNVDGYMREERHKITDMLVCILSAQKQLC